MEWLWDKANKVLSITQDIDRLQKDVAELRADLKSLSDKVGLLAVAQLTEQERQRAEREKAEAWRQMMEARASSEAQIQTLRLELALSRLGTALPSVTTNTATGQISGTSSE